MHNNCSNKHSDSPSNFLSDFLQNCQQIVEQNLFNKWFSDLQLIAHNPHEITLNTPSKFVRDWLNRQFFSQKTFLQNLNKFYPQLKKINALFLEQQKPQNNIINLSQHDNIFAYGTELNNKFTFANFVGTKYNKIAISMAKIVAKMQDSPAIFGDKIPLFIHGNVGMGKTHLAQAIAWQLKEHEVKQKVVYLSAEKFMFHFVQSIRNNDTMLFKERMRSIDTLIVDDVQFIAGKESTQQEFMNCFNSLVEDNKQVILVCDRCPSALENIDEKLKSRISGGMIAELKNPDFSDRLDILQHKISSFNLNLNQDIIHFLATNIKGSVRDLEGALKKILSEQLFGNCEISLRSIQSMLVDYIKANDKFELSCQQIQKIVADYYQIRLVDLTSESRMKQFVKPRQIAMYLAKKLTEESLQSISLAFAKKNHATVLHAIKAVEKLLLKCGTTRNELQFLQQKLG